MYIIKNAFKNLGRNKGRNLLIGIIIFILILSTTIAMVINTASKGIIEDYQNRFGSDVSIAIDFSKLDFNDLGEMTLADPITTKQYTDLAKSKTLKSHTFLASYNANLKSAKAVAEDETNDGNNVFGTTGIDVPTVNILGYSNHSLMSEFNDGMRKITEGEMYKHLNECIISKKLADLNKIKVGDEIEIKSPNNKTTKKLVISGIYTDATDEYGGMGNFVKGAMFNKRNEILTSYETLTKNFDGEYINVDAHFELKSPDLLDEFKKDAKAIGIGDDYKITTDEATYNKIVSPVLGLSKISMTFLKIVLAIGIIVLLIISFIAIRERKYELGVLRAMGMKKLKLALMLMTESFIITVICLSIGLAAGTALSQPIADYLIEDQAKISQENQQSEDSGIINIMSIGEMADENQPKPLSEINVSLSLESILNICAISLLIALITSSIGVIAITRYEPIKILSERN